MKSCIYQKTDPVDIPQAETRILKDVLALPWGFEIYSLLTRWNPLDLRRPTPRAASGKRTLVVGMGPAGFTLAHHLLNDGHLVAAIDGLKIEPLPPALSGVAANGKRVPFEPCLDAAILNEPLDDRVMAGFGGVAEYGSPCGGTRTSSRSSGCSSSGAVHSRSTAASASAARSIPTARSSSASITSLSRPAPAGRRCSNCRTGSRRACAPRRIS
jgi:hypothetical protein